VRARLAHRGPVDRPQQIVALPLSAPRQRERGFNQAGEIATRVAAATALPVFAPLERVGGALPQAALPWAARRRNMRGAFALRRPVRGARIALVDDVMTTGATLAEAAGVLIDAGALRVECWVVARTPRPEPA
jgi:ComF family protein